MLLCVNQLQEMTTDCLSSSTQGRRRKRRENNVLHARAPRLDASKPNKKNVARRRRGLSPIIQEILILKDNASQSEQLAISADASTKQRLPV